LYDSFTEKGWLLTGPPTEERVRRLNHGVSGPYVSVDYSAATDRIKTCFVQAMVEVLLEKSVGLTSDEVEALDVLANLRFDPNDPVAVRGQPMGSPMSFPLLCLINKAVVDLALADLQENGRISAKQFAEHRCLINGDDLLYREFDSSRGILAGILRNGALTGLVVNEEKTMVSAVWAELNSTAFYNGERRKKTNVGVLVKRNAVSDPIGYIADSVVRRRNFRRLLLFWEKPIRYAERKLQGPIPRCFYSALWCVRDALCSAPRGRAKPTNPFPVVPRPAGYDLSREKEVALIHQRVARLKAWDYRPEKPVRSQPTLERVSIQLALRRRRPAEEDNILKVLADGWHWEVKEKLRIEDDAGPTLTTWAWGSESKACLLLDVLAAFRQRKRLGCANPDAGPSCPGDGDPFSRGDSFIAFDDPVST
jgi:hypothetical protein